MARFLHDPRSGTLQASGYRPGNRVQLVLMDRGAEDLAPGIPSVEFTQEPQDGLLVEGCAPRSRPPLSRAIVGLADDAGHARRPIQRSPAVVGPRVSLRRSTEDDGDPHRAADAGIGRMDRHNLEGLPSLRLPL